MCACKLHEARRSTPLSAGCAQRGGRICAWWKKDECNEWNTNTVTTSPFHFSCLSEA